MKNVPIRRSGRRPKRSVRGEGVSGGFVISGEEGWKQARFTHCVDCAAYANEVDGVEDAGHDKSCVEVEGHGF